MGRHADLMAEIEITADATCAYCAGVLVGGMRGDRFGWLHSLDDAYKAPEVHTGWPAENTITWRVSEETDRATLAELIDSGDRSRETVERIVRLDARVGVRA